MNVPSLCPFCFETLTGNGPCPHCGHRIGEPTQGLQQLPVGWILDGKYRIGMALGQGGFGITYLAYDMNLQQKVAVKEYFPGGLVTRSSQFVTPYTQSGQGLYAKGVDAFYREGQLLARFQNHPNIVHIHNFFRENNTAYFVMEYVEGKSLAAYLNEKDGRLSQEETISLLSPIMDALDTLHQAGILHRDIAPDNIYLTKAGQVKLLDFGAAKNELSQHTHSSAAILKPGYAPLEQYSVTGNQGPWTDVYAMGAVIYRCLTGMMPPDAPDRITGRELPLISVSGAKASKTVETAVMKALALNIPDRWQRMSDLKNALCDPAVKIADSKRNTKNLSLSEQQKKKGKRINSIIPILIFIIVSIVLVFVSLNIVIPNYRYDKAVQLMNSENYSEAVTVFSDLGKFKDSQQKFLECEREVRFEQMLGMMSSGTIAQTVEAYKILVEYSDKDHYEKAIGHEVQVLTGLEPEKAAEILESIDYDDALLLLDRIHDSNSQFGAAILSECSLKIQLAYLDAGDTLKLGRYEQDDNTANGDEDIEWLILEKQNEVAFLISKKALDSMPFNTNDSLLSWDQSSIRYWLNHEFFNQAFTSDEQSLIQDTLVRAEENPTFTTKPGNDTMDKIFLLSINEVKKYFLTEESRKAGATSYAKGQDANTTSSGLCWWWLRSPGRSGKYISYVSSNGVISTMGFISTSAHNSVRPALWINFNQ